MGGKSLNDILELSIRDPLFFRFSDPMKNIAKDDIAYAKIIPQLDYNN
jgi:hypothetical protein